MKSLIKLQEDAIQDLLEAPIFTDKRSMRYMKPKGIKKIGRTFREAVRKLGYSELLIQYQWTDVIDMYNLRKRLTATEVS